MTSRNWILRIASIAALAFSPAAFAGTSLSIVAAPTYMMASASGLPDSDVAPTSSMGLQGGGLLLEFGGQKMGLELGGIYSTRAVSSSQYFTSVKIPAMLKFHLSPKFHLNLGGYYNYQLSQTGDYSINGAIVDGNDYGAQAGLGFRFGGNTGFRLDANYAYALKNVASSGTLNLNYVEILVGLQFGGGK